MIARTAIVITTGLKDLNALPLQRIKYEVYESKLRVEMSNYAPGVRQTNSLC